MADMLDPEELKCFAAYSIPVHILITLFVFGSICLTFFIQASGYSVFDEIYATLYILTSHSIRPANTHPAGSPQWKPETLL